MIKISAIQNYLPMVDRPYLVHTETREVLTFSELVDRMAAGRTTVTKTDIVATMQLFVEELLEDLAMGYSVKLPFGSFYLCASGTFKELDQAFSYGDKQFGHDLRLHFRANRVEEIKLAQNTKVSREFSVDKIAPRVFKAHSVRTDEELVASPGDFVRIRGHHLKFDKARLDTGVWFNNGSEHRSAQYASITPGTVIAQVPPDLAPGQYTIVVRTSPNEKDVKSAVLSDPVSVV